MTAKRRNLIPCPHCGKTINPEDVWKTWIRNNPNLDSQKHGLFIMDGDLWVHHFGKRRSRTKGWDRDRQYLMLVEIKSMNQQLTEEQRDTLNFIDKCLRTKPLNDPRDRGRMIPGHNQNIRQIWSKIAGKSVQGICHGVHVLRMSGLTPGTSDEMYWDDKPITAQQFERLLRYELDPDSLREMELREHKKYREDIPMFMPDGTYATELDADEADDELDYG